ncbi:MAG TPA: hypothetical protein VFY99_02425, partial [Solirubrobacterales bacterium]
RPLGGIGVLRRGPPRRSFDRVYQQVGRERCPAARREGAGRPGPRGRRRGDDANLEEQLASQPPEIEAEILRINEEARPEALQVALAIPLLAAVLGFVFSMRMMRLPDPAPIKVDEAAAFS